MNNPTTKRVTVNFDAALHRALKSKAAETDRSISDLVNDAVRVALVEYADDCEAFEARASQPDYAFKDAVKELKRRGKL